MTFARVSQEQHRGPSGGNHGPSANAAPPGWGGSSWSLDGGWTPHSYLGRRARAAHLRRRVGHLRRHRHPQAQVPAAAPSALHAQQTSWTKTHAHSSLQSHRLLLQWRVQQNARKMPFEPVVHSSLRLVAGASAIVADLSVKRKALKVDKLKATRHRYSKADMRQGGHPEGRLNFRCCGSRSARTT